MDSFKERKNSCLEHIFPNLEDVHTNNPSAKIHSANRRVDAKTMIEELVRSQPFFAKRTKSAGLRTDKMILAGVPRFYRALDGLRQGSYSTFIEFVRMQPFDGVKLYHSSVKNGRMMPPRMSIDIDEKLYKAEPGDSVRINTGYIINLPRIARERNCKDGKIVVANKATKQQDFVVIPIVVSNSDCVIIPCVTARDPDDTGLFTVNVTVVSGKLKSLRVMFTSCLVEQNTDFVELSNPEPNAEIFKMKDTWEGRLVKNLKMKTDFGNSVQDEDGAVSFRTYNSIVRPPVMYEKQRLTIRDHTVLFVSRKREWFNPDLVTLGGIYDGEEPGRSVMPQVIKVGKAPPPKNTHCLVFVSAKASLFSEEGKSTNLFKVLNGAFIDHPAYSDLTKCMRQFINSSRSLSAGYDIAKQFAKKHDLDASKLLRLYDYHRYLIDDVKLLKEKMLKTDEELIRHPSVKSKPLSSQLKSCLETLYENTFGVADCVHDDNTEPFLKRSCDTDSDESDAKRIKI